MPTEAYRRVQRARDLRNNATPEERRLWRVLSEYRPPFMRQLRIGPFYGDIVCRAARVVVELDGSQHVDNPHDDERTAGLESLGWRVLRFWNRDVWTNLEGVVTAILAECEPRLPPGKSFAAIAPRAGRERKPRERKEPPPTPPANAGGE